MRSLRVVFEFLGCAFLWWLYAGDLIVYAQAHSAPSALLNQLPSVGLSIVGVSVALGATVVFVMARAGRLPFPRAEPMALGAVALLLFADFVVLAGSRSPEPAELRLSSQVQHFAQLAQNESSGDTVVTEPRVLAELARQTEPPPLFREGVPVNEWKVEVRRKCGAPALEHLSAQVGTLIYCVAEDRKRAWITAVASKVEAPVGAVGVNAHSHFIAEIRAGLPPEGQQSVEGAGEEEINGEPPHPPE